MDWDFDETSEGFEQQQNGILEAFNNALSMLLARMTKEQMQMAVGNKSDTVLTNILISASNKEYYEVCHVIKEELDKRAVSDKP